MGAGSLARTHGLLIGATAGSNVMFGTRELNPACPDGTFSVCAGFRRAPPPMVLTRFWFPAATGIETWPIIDAPARAPRAPVTGVDLEVAWATATEPPAAVNRTATHNAIFNVLIRPVYRLLFARTTRATTPLRRKLDV
jgi:hypothetical protein